MISCDSPNGCRDTPSSNHSADSPVVIVVVVNEDHIPERTRKIPFLCNDFPNLMGYDVSNPNPQVYSGDY